MNTQHLQYVVEIERMRSILEQPVQTGTEDFRPSSYDITFDHVSFAYREGAGVLEDVSFTARQGEVTALIGPSGGGKSTACKLAARFWDVTAGKVLLGGTDVSTVDPETLLRSYSMVFQDVVLFRDTVMENICHAFLNRQRKESRSTGASKTNNLSPSPR